MKRQGSPGRSASPDVKRVKSRAHFMSTEKKNPQQIQDFRSKNYTADSALKGEYDIVVLGVGSGGSGCGMNKMHFK